MTRDFCFFLFVRLFLTEVNSITLNYHFPFKYSEKETVPIGVPANLVSFGNSSSPSGHVTDNLSGSLLKMRERTVFL